MSFNLLCSHFSFTHQNFIVSTWDLYLFIVKAKVAGSPQGLSTQRPETESSCAWSWTSLWVYVFSLQV